MYWIIMYILEFLKLDLVLVKLIGYERKNSNYPFALAFICVLSIVFITNEYGLNDNYLTYAVGSIAVITMILSLRNNRSILIVILAYLIICVIDMILGGFLALSMGYTVDMILDNDILKFIGNSISIIVLIFLYSIKRLMKRGKFHIHNYGINRRYIIIAFLGVLGIALYITPVQILGLMQNSEKIKLFTILGISLSGVAFIIICIVLIILNSNNRYYQECLKINGELLEQQKEYYNMLIEKEYDTKKFRHDMKNHIYCVQKLCEDEKFKEVYQYMIDMQAVMETFKIDIHTGNDIVNVIVADILGKKMRKDISLKWRGTMPNELKISNMDLCSIFSNLFKNAIEATEKILNTSEKIIEVGIRCLGTSLMIQIRNPITERINIINNKLVTSKGDKSKHGFGSLNVQNVVNKYEGSIKYTSTDNSFLAEIIFEDIIM